jgi:hypothetical protein
MTKPKSILAEIRKQMMVSGASETELLADEGFVKNLFDQIQGLRLEMNEAKKAAAAEAAKPYLEMIEKIEKQYALMIKLSSR